jgi:hypothetical protein
MPRRPSPRAPTPSARPAGRELALASPRATAPADRRTPPRAAAGRGALRGPRLLRGRGRRRPLLRGQPLAGRPARAAAELGRLCGADAGAGLSSIVFNNSCPPPPPSVFHTNSYRKLPPLNPRTCPHDLLHPPQVAALSAALELAIDLPTGALRGGAAGPSSARAIMLAPAARSRRRLTAARAALRRVRPALLRAAGSALPAAAARPAGGPPPDLSAPRLFALLRAALRARRRGPGGRRARPPPPGHACGLRCPGHRRRRLARYRAARWCAVARSRGGGGGAFSTTRTPSNARGEGRGRGSLCGGGGADCFCVILGEPMERWSGPPGPTTDRAVPPRDPEPAAAPARAGAGSPRSTSSRSRRRCGRLQRPTLASQHRPATIQHPSTTSK